jgi:hypothetical protein
MRLDPHAALFRCARDAGRLNQRFTRCLLGRLPIAGRPGPRPIAVTSGCSDETTSGPAALRLAVVAALIMRPPRCPRPGRASPAGA